MISLVFFGDLKYCPYLYRYTERLDKNKMKYEVLFWNRGGFKLTLPENYYWYDSVSSESLSRTRKIFDFIGFRKWVMKKLKDSNPEGIILLSTLSGMFLADELRKYKNRYIFDIRDHSYEHIGFYRLIEKRLINDSYFTAISSKGFRAFLPEHDYIIAHNLNRHEVKKNVHLKKEGLPIRLVWNGTIRFFDFQKKYIDSLKNDSRFLMVYHGTGTEIEQYKKYCNDNKITNVIFTGVYDNSEKSQLIKGAGILNNCYGGKGGDSLRWAVSNRYYDGLIYHIPQLVEPEGYKSQITQEAGVGVALAADQLFADKLYSYYMNIDEYGFDTACEAELNKVLCEDDIYISRIDDFVRHIEGKGNNEKK